MRKPAGPKPTSEAARPVRKPASKSASPADRQPPIESRRSKRRSGNQLASRRQDADRCLRAPHRAAKQGERRRHRACRPRRLNSSPDTADMRDFNITAEPAGAIQPRETRKAVASARSAKPCRRCGRPPLCHPEARCEPSPLRLPPWLERRPEELGLRQGTQLPHRRPPPRRAGGRSPD